MTGGGVGGSTGDVIPDGGLSGSGHNMRPNHSSIFDVSLGGATTGIVGGGTDPLGNSTVGTTRVVTLRRILKGCSDLFQTPSC